MRLPRPIAIDTLLIWLVVLLPSTGMMLFHAGSMSSGLLVACLAILAIEAASFGRIRTDLCLNSRPVRALAVVGVLLVAHALVVSVLFGGVDWVRLLGSLVMVAIVLLAAACVRYRLVRHSSDEVHRILVWTGVMMTLLAARSLVGSPVFPPVTHPRPVVVFIEPSHFALSFIPFVGYMIVQARGRARVALAVAAVALGLVLGSTTLLAGLVMMLVTCLPWWQSAAFAVVAAAVGVGVGFDASFIVNRIVFSDDVRNLSNLVLLQGWERAWLTLVETHGLGVGFQQFGVWGPIGEIQELIAAITGDYLNLNDGGTTASKLVGEFGVVGVGVVAAFLAWWWRLSASMRQALRGRREPSLNVFAAVCVIAIAVELFVRGVGYLSMGLFLFGLVFAGPPLQAKAPAAAVAVAVPRRPGFLARLRRELAILSHSA